MKVLCLLSILLSLSYQQVLKDTKLYAKCIFKQSSNSGITGEIFFSQNNPNSIIKISGQVNSLIYPQQGFHIHVNPVDGNDCNSTGAHFNPDNTTHGAPTDNIKHAGDLGNLKKNDNGVASVDIEASLLSLDPSNKYYIIGKSCIIHETTDDLGKGTGDSLLNGNSGPRVACGTIVKALSSTSSLVMSLLTILIIICILG